MKGLMPDHVHMMISIPPKYAVSQVIGYVKGKSAIHLARVYGERRRQPSGPRSKSWLRNVVTSQPIGANSWSSPPVRGWRPRTLSPCYSRPRQAREQAPDPDAPPSASRSSLPIGRPLSLLIAPRSTECFEVAFTIPTRPGAIRLWDPTGGIDESLGKGDS